jgi:hypothetical protein
MVDGVWTEQEYADFGLEAGATEVAFSPDGETIFFLSTQLLDGESLAPGERRGVERIWYAPRTPHGIGTPRPLPGLLAYPTHWQFSVAESGNLYFTSRGRGAADIYVAPFEGTGYSEPRPLGYGVNSASDENCPFIAPDESYLIFTRHDQEHGDPDLFISYRRPEGSWIEAEPLPSPINSAHTEIYPLVTPDGEYLFFLSWREGAGRMFWVETDFLRRNIP